MAVIQIGQGVLGRIQFRDGNAPEYPRPYLVVFVSATQVGLLNVSSVLGKEHKLLFSTNKHLMKYDPPFQKDSFVKLDSLVYVDLTVAVTFRILHNGDSLDQGELKSIFVELAKNSRGPVFAALASGMK